MSNEEIVARIQAGNHVSDHMLALYNQMSGLIAKIAWDYRGLETQDDLKQEGALALYRAVQGYDPSRGTLFTTYAGLLIRQDIQRYIEDCGSVVRIPGAQRALIGQYRQITVAYEAEHGELPPDWFAAAALGISDNQMERLKRDMGMAAIGSLDVPMWDEGDSTLGNYQAAPGDDMASVEEEAARQAGQAIWGVVDTLPDKQRQALTSRYREDLTLRETAERMGLRSVEGIRQHERQALAALRRLSYRHKLEPYLEIYNMALQGTGAGSFRRTWTSATERTAIKLTELCADRPPRNGHQHGSEGIVR